MGLLELGNNGEIVVYRGRESEQCFVCPGKLGFFVRKPDLLSVTLGDVNYRKKYRVKTETQIINFQKLKDKHNKFKKWLRHTMSLSYVENGKNCARLNEDLVVLNKAKYVHIHLYSNQNWFSILMEKTNVGYKVYSLNETSLAYQYRKFKMTLLTKNVSSISELGYIIKNELWCDEVNKATSLDLNYNPFYLIPEEKAKEFIKEFEEYRNFYVGLYTE